MKITYTDELPTLDKFKKNRIQNVIENFFNRPERVMTLTWEEGCDYKDDQSMYGTFSRAARRSKRPLKIIKDGNDIYLIKILKTDAE